MEKLYEFDAGDYKEYAIRRESQPIFQDPVSKIWHIYSYSEIQKVLVDTESFSSEIFEKVGKPELKTLATMDRPRHKDLRQLLAKAFTSDIINAQVNHIQEFVDSIIDQVIEKGEIDIVKDIAFPLPAYVIAKMLGLPTDPASIQQLKEWAIAAVQVAESAIGRAVPAAVLLAQVKEMTDYFAQIAEQRRAQPQLDLMTALVQAEVGGMSLTTEEISNMCKLVAVAGFDTSTIFIGNAMHILFQLPELKSELISNEALMETFLEEVLRYATPFQAFARFAKKETQIGEFTINAGDWVMIFNGSGNRDEKVFDNADEFNPQRNPNRHLSFGHGIHYCIGAPLGRLEAKIAIATLLKRLPDIRLDPNKPTERLKPKVQFGFTSLPAIFSTGAAN
ncbi:MAG: cytochrome P450 [Burkholderiales bacterium]|nr:cytochrome P450 [Burkholderiales bacterium]